MLKGNRLHPPTLKALSSLVLVLFVVGSLSAIAASSSGFASVTITNRSKEEIATATTQVFTADGYRSSKSSSGQMIFDKAASRGTTLAREGIVGTQGGAQTINRVRADIVSLGNNSYLLQCKAFMVTGGGDAFFQEEVPLAHIRKGPYESLLKKVQKQLK